MIGIPNDTGGVVLWVWFATIAWNIDAPRSEHLDFWRDWWRPLLVLVVYWLLRGLADEIGIAGALHDADPLRRVARRRGRPRPSGCRTRGAATRACKTCRRAGTTSCSPPSTPPTSWSG